MSHFHTQLLSESVNNHHTAGHRWCRTVVLNWLMTQWWVTSPSLVDFRGCRCVGLFLECFLGFFPQDQTLKDNLQLHNITVTAKYPQAVVLCVDWYSLRRRLMKHDATIGLLSLSFTFFHYEMLSHNTLNVIETKCVSCGQTS